MKRLERLFRKIGEADVQNPILQESVLVIYFVD